MARTGRRPGNQDTREAILIAARKAFADGGYDGASIRAIATSAGVDPALVHHYFGAKDQLFLAAMQVPINPAKIIPQVLDGDPDHIGERLVRTVLSVWDSPAGAAAAALLRSAVQHEWVSRMMKQFMLSQIIPKALPKLATDPKEAQLRGSLVVSQIAGLVMARYIIRVDPLANASPEMVVALIAPTIQRYVTMPLPVGALEPAAP